MRFDTRPLPRKRARFVSRVLSATLAVLTAWTPALVYAQESEPEPVYLEADTQISEDVAEAVTRSPDVDERIDPDALSDARVDPSAAEAPPTETDPEHTPISLPGGTEASAATPQAISLPDAEGSIEGMGESFSPVLSSGTATFSVPIAVAPGRAGVQPSLGLSYGSTNGNGPVGFGWGMGAPFISRQTDRGLPRYIDEPAWHEEEDRFMYNGGQELVPVDTAAVAAIEASAAGSAPAVHADVDGWQQYRARVEGGFMRFFRSPDSTRWIVQSKDGTRFDFGLLPTGEAPSEAIAAAPNALERDPERASGGVFRWSLTRMSDAHGSTVYYLYDQDDGRSYLRDLYYVSPNDCAAGTPDATRECTEPLSAYASRVHIVYETRADVFAGYVSGWRIGTAWRVKRIEVTAWHETGRTLVRRYHLRYRTDSFHSLLHQVQVEGRPQTLVNGSMVGDATIAESSLGDAMVGETLPPMTFRYSEMPSSSDAVPGFGGIDASMRAVVNSPPHSVDEGRSDLFDVNSDGLPDLIVTDPARFRTDSGEPAVGVFFNGFTGADATPAGEAAHFSDAVTVPMRGDLSTVLSLSNANVVPMDIDGDGRSDLLHMPRYRSYGWWSPAREAGPDGAEPVSPADQAWRWVYSSVQLPPGDTDPRIDLGRDASHIKVLDVNNDHLIDIVRTTGTVMQTWLNLGWLPGGDGRFGSYRWTGTEYEMSTVPYESCLLQGGTPIDFDDPEVRLGDMNGDGLQDIVQMRRGRVIYWPGRGEGVWGTGSRSCARGEGAGRYIEMSSPPMELSPELDNVFLSDVNMDGASDLVQVRFREVDVWFNRAGEGWTRRTIARGTPAAPGFAPRIRFADIDGSSTTDIIWGTGGGWQYIDPAGGQRPRLLIGVDNGLGADTTITYGSSAEDYLADLEEASGASASGVDRFTWTHRPDGPDQRLCDRAGIETSAECQACPAGATASECDALVAGWLTRSSGSPVISNVVRGVSTTDRFDVLGRTAQVTESRFAYHDGYYEGIEQEFRGFGAADAVTVGDWNNPDVYSRTHFLQGRRPHSIADDRLAHNPYEALKGREVRTEVFDEAGVFLSTSFATITNRLLYSGLNGVPVYYAFVNETNELRYDTTNFSAGTSMTVPAIVGQSLSASGVVTGTVTEESLVVPVRNGNAARIKATFDSVDALGHVLQQTAYGSVDPASGAPIDETFTSYTTPTLVNAAAWIWRTARSYMRGEDASEPNFGDGSSTYDLVTGDLLSATQFVTSPASFTFGEESAAEGGAQAFTQADQNMVASTVYDGWGNALQSCAGHDLGETATDPTNPPTACLRFGNVVYDTQFAQLAASEHLAIDRTSGSTVTRLAYVGTWDRGLGAITSSTDPNSLSTSVTYDGLGRLTSVTPPHHLPLCAGMPTTRIQYELTSSPASQPLSRVVSTTVLDCTLPAGTEGAELTSIAYVDGLGRARSSLATGDSASEWIRGGITTFDKKGTVRRTYQPDVFSGSLTDYRAAVALPPDIPYAVTRYDAFGRAKGVITEDGAVTWTSYHSLSTDVCDPLDNDPSSPHYRTCTTAYTDGHGRVIDQILRNRNPDTGASEVYRLWSYYRPDGAVEALVRANSSSGAARPATPGAASGQHVERTFVYDSVGRRLSSDDPDSDNGADPTEATNSWRYLFNKVGDLVAVRDPRGCGQNFFYDLGGRLRGEQYVSCAEAQPAAAEQPPADNSVGHLTALEYSSGAVMLDVVYHYDTYPQWAIDRGAGFIPQGASGTQGLATGVSDRAQRAVLAYDDRGNVTWTARQLALISAPIGLNAITVVDGRPVQTEQTVSPGTLEYDVTHTYTRTAAFDHANRPTSMTLPRDPDYDALATAPLVEGTLLYNRRGLPRQATAVVDGTPHTVVESIAYLRDGLVGSITYGDDLMGTRMPTTSSTTYDVRRRPVRMRTTRDTTGMGGVGQELEAVTTVVDQELVWDAANNLTATVDHRDGAEWPAGFRPQTTYISHDALYRVVGADFEYTQADGARTMNDIGTDWRDNYAQAPSVDPMRQTPAPAVVDVEGMGRVESLRWSWDYLANTTSWTDNDDAFYERSIGAIGNGNSTGETSGSRPSALYVASNLTAGVAGSSNGWVEVDYGVGGNVVGMTVHAQCSNGASACVDPEGDSDARRAALRANCDCATEQHYAYRWDELNRLAEARRYDYEGIAWVRKVRQRYRYDGANSRTVKQTLESGSTPEAIALYPYPGDFERRGLTRGLTAYEASSTLETETQYVVAGARMVWKHGGAGAGYDRENRLAVPIGDLIQTTGAVFDVRSGELLEVSTYYPNGARETYLNDDSARAAPEVTGFTGKEADEEVGVVYFGERYLIPRLGRWASPDPLHVHASGGGEALNSYHYVSGNLLEGRDELGLCDGSEACDALGTALVTYGIGGESRDSHELLSPDVHNWTYGDNPLGPTYEGVTLSQLVQGDFHEDRDDADNQIVQTFIGFIPGVGFVTGARDAVAAAVEGDAVGAGLGVVSMVPGGRILRLLRSRQPAGRALTVLLDNDVMVAAAERSTTTFGRNATQAISAARDRFITPNQLREFLHVPGMSRAQRQSRLQWMQQHDIQVLDPDAAEALSSSPRFREVFDALRAEHGRGDAALVAFARVAGWRALTGNTSLVRYIRDTIGASSSRRTLAAEVLQAIDEISH